MLKQIASVCCKRMGVWKYGLCGNKSLYCSLGEIKFQPFLLVYNFVGSVKSTSLGSVLVVTCLVVLVFTCHLNLFTKFVACFTSLRMPYIALCFIIVYLHFYKSTFFLVTHFCTVTCCVFNLWSSSCRLLVTVVRRVKV